MVRDDSFSFNIASDNNLAGLSSSTVDEPIKRSPVITRKRGSITCVTMAVFCRFEFKKRLVNMATNCEANRSNPDKSAMSKKTKMF